MKIKAKLEKLQHPVMPAAMPEILRHSLAKVAAAAKVGTDAAVAEVVVGGLIKPPVTTKCVLCKTLSSGLQHRLSGSRILAISRICSSRHNNSQCRTFRSIYLPQANLRQI